MTAKVGLTPSPTSLTTHMPFTSSSVPFTPLSPRFRVQTFWPFELSMANTLPDLDTATSSFCNPNWSRWRFVALSAGVYSVDA